MPVPGRVSAFSKICRASDHLHTVNVTLQQAWQGQIHAGTGCHQYPLCQMRQRHHDDQRLKPVCGLCIHFPELIVALHLRESDLTCFACIAQAPDQ